ncbi:MAG: amino acid permease [Cuniculiplasma sp.]
MTESSENKGELGRHLTFKDVFFLSFGGMSPLLSILTYGAFAITLAGNDAPIVMIIGTLLVLVNGLSVTQLSKRFSTSGGYYTYAFQALSARIGFDTGWMYMFYSVLYGLAYLVGGIFIITTVLGISGYLAFLLIMVPSITFLIVGISASAKYALFAVIIEIGLMLSIALYSFYLTKGAAYIPNPSVYPISGGDFVLGILFAMGIPTGYGSIAPVSGEVKDPKKVVGRSVISVILIGGTLATFMIYAIANLLLQNHLVIPVADKLPVIGILKNDFGGLSTFFYFAVAIATINDSILAILSFGSAATRTLFRMGYDRTLPGVFGKKFKDKPLVATLFVSAIMIIIPVLLMGNISTETAFIILGTISAMGGLFIHVSANFSLIRIGFRRGRRLAQRAKGTVLSYVSDYREFILALTGAVISSIVLVYSAYSTVPVYTTIFLVWIVIGFILSEVKGIIGKTPYDADVSKEGIIVAQNLINVVVSDVVKQEKEAMVSLNDSLRDVLNGLLSRNLPAAIVVDKDQKPVGRLEVINLLLLPKSTIDRGLVKQTHLERSVNIKGSENVADAIRILKENNINILTVVDGVGKATGTINERDVLAKLSEVNRPEID